MGQIDFKRWSLELTIHNLAVARAAASGSSAPAGRDTDKAGENGAVSPRVKPPSPAPSPQLQIKRLYIDAELESLWRLNVKETVLSDFFARVIVTPEGRFNLQDLLEPAAPADAKAATATTPPTQACS